MCDGGLVASHLANMIGEVEVQVRLRYWPEQLLPSRSEVTIAHVQTARIVGFRDFWGKMGKWG